MKDKDFEMYLEKWNKEQKIYMPLPFLMAKRVKKNSLKMLSVKFSNQFYGTEDFAPTLFYKSVGALLPEETLDTLYNEKTI